MAKRERRERKRGVRREGRHEAEARQHQKGGEFVCFTLPDGVTLFKPEKDKTYHVDVLPYIAGKYNKACKPGDEFYTLTYPLYRSLGIEEKPYIAIGDLLGVKDPITEHFAHLRKAGEEWDNMKMFRSTERQMWLIFVHEQADKGLQLFDASYQTFGKLLKKEIDDSGEVDWIDNFDDIEGGATIKVRFEAKQVMSNTWITADKITFKEREDGFTADGDKKLAEKILDQVEGICLDDLLKIPSYETLQAALDGVPVRDGDDDDDDEKPAKGRKTRSRTEEDEPKSKSKAAKAKPEPDDDDDDDEPPAKPAKKTRKPVTAEDLGIVKGGTVEHDKYGVCVVLKVAPDGLSVSLKDDDGDVHREVDPSDLEPVVEKAKPAKTKVKPAPVEEDDEGDDDDDIAFDDDDDDEPPAKPKAKAKTKPKPEPDDDDDDDDEPPAKPKAKAKAPAKSKAKPPVDDDDDDDDDDDAPAKPAKAGTKKTGKDKNWDEDWEDD